MSNERYLIGFNSLHIDDIRMCKEGLTLILEVHLSSDKENRVINIDSANWGSYVYDLGYCDDYDGCEFVVDWVEDFHDLSQIDGHGQIEGTHIISHAEMIDMLTSEQIKMILFKELCRHQDLEVLLFKILKAA